MIIKLKDKTLSSIETDSDFMGGYCDTCDYGSYYIQDIDLYYTNNNECSSRTHISLESDYRSNSYSYGDMISFFLNNAEELEKLSAIEFEKLLIEDIGKKIEGHSVIKSVTKR